LLLIPVIDLLDGRAVRARLGLRHDYRPLQSPLCEQGEVLPLVRRLVDRFGFTRVYLADLNAIQEQGENFALLEQLSHRVPELELWVDAGFRGPADIERLCARVMLRPVIGSESWRSRDALPGPSPILSIDSDESGLRDPSGISADPERRPTDLILMNLSRIGGELGPDLEWLRHWRERAPGSRLYAAGGVRDRTDLQRLRAAGATGVLLSSALHRGDLSTADLAGFS
jgi:phosphoribosylformimino-5-aminoimidazole carboxamide ribotide isomerase